MAITKVTRTLLSTGIVDNSNATAITIDSSENVGIGTTSPTEALSISSNDGLVSTTSTASKTAGVLTGGYLIYSGDGSGAGDGNRAGIQSFSTNSVGSTYDLRFYTSNGSTNLVEGMRIDSSGNVGIGDTSPDQKLHVNSGSSNVVAKFESTDSIAVIQLKDNNGEAEIGAIGNDIGFYPAGAERMRIASNGQVLLTAAHPSIQFTDSSDNSDAYIQADGGTLKFFADDNNEVGSSLQSFHIDGSEKMRIDSSGNLLVGKTSASITTAGAELRPNGQVFATQSGNYPLLLNRTTSDGDIIQLRKDNTTVGSIGATSGVLTIGNNNSGGIIFGYSGSHTFIEPSNTSGASVDDGATLGSSSKRFKDLYLSGIANIGTYLRFGGASNYYIHSDNANYLRFGTAGSERMRISASGRLLVGGSTDRGGNICVGGTSTTARVIPQSDNVGYVGQSDFRWQAIYAVSGSIQTSDEREKTEIKETTLGLDFIKDLKPVSYKWIDGEQQNKGKDEREHQGLIAQQVAETVEKHGVNKNDFGGLDIQKTEKYDDFYGMSYDQLIAPLIKAIQEQQTIIDDLKTRIETLENV